MLLKTLMAEKLNLARQSYNKPLKHRTNLGFVLDSLDARRLVERYVQNRICVNRFH